MNQFRVNEDEERNRKEDEPLRDLSDELESLLDSLVGDLDSRLESGVVGISVELEKVEGVVSSDGDEVAVGGPGDLNEGRRDEIERMISTCLSHRPKLYGKSEMEK